MKPKMIPLLSDLSKIAYTNDLGIDNIGDPYILKADDGFFYLYCTSAPNGFYCWKSQDMVNWTDKKMCYIQKPDSWGMDCFWAPEVIAYENRYYMFYTARSRKQKSLRIGLATSTRPDGIFEDVKNEPLFDFGYAAIDGNVLIDEDGSKYLYYSRDCSENEQNGIKISEIYGIRLSDDLLSVEGDAVKLTAPEQEWEKISENPLWNEGPEVLKRNGIYYLSYSGNCFADRAYSVGFARSDSPLGPFVKEKENPVLTALYSNAISGSGHHGFTISPDGTENWVSYHTHTDLTGGGGNRKVNIDRFAFAPDGKMHFNGPTITPQPFPSSAAHPNLTPEAEIRAEGSKRELLKDGIFSVLKKDSRFDEVFSVSESGTLTVSVSFSERKRVSSVWVYPGAGTYADIESMRILFDGDRQTETIEKKSEDLYGASVYAVFEPQETKEMKIEIMPRKGAEEIRLSEIMVFG